jgi:hypothetical protein
MLLAATWTGGSATDRFAGLQGVGVAPQDVGDDSGQRRRVEADTGRTLGLRHWRGRAHLIFTR